MIQKTQCRFDKHKHPLPPLIQVGRAATVAEVCPCEWCRRPTVWEFTMLGAARPVRACNDLCAKRALRLAERQEVAACRPDHAEKALRRPACEGATEEDIEGRRKAVASRRLNPWGHFAPRPAPDRPDHANKSNALKRGPVR